MGQSQQKPQMQWGRVSRNLKRSGAESAGSQPSTVAGREHRTSQVSHQMSIQQPRGCGPQPFSREAWDSPETKLQLPHSPGPGSRPLLALSSFSWFQTRNYIPSPYIRTSGEPWINVPHPSREESILKPEGPEFSLQNPHRKGQAQFEMPEIPEAGGLLEFASQPVWYLVRSMPHRDPDSKQDRTSKSNPRG